MQSVEFNTLKPIKLSTNVLSLPKTRQINPKKVKEGESVRKASGLPKTAKNGRKEVQLTETLKHHKKMLKASVYGGFYSYCSTRENPEYEQGKRVIHFESSLIHNKSDKILVETKPKWLTTLAKNTWSDEFQDYGVTEVLETNNFKSANYRKIKALDRFCSKYQPLYAEKKVTLFFMTFTGANKCRPWKEMMGIISHYFKRTGNPVLDYVWTAEISDRLHFHYHLCVATKRMNLKNKKIPKLLKFDKIWGQRTEIDFVKKNVRHYMAKYFAKNNARAKMFDAETGKISHVRSYGISRMK